MTGLNNGDVGESGNAVATFSYDSVEDSGHDSFRDDFFASMAAAAAERDADGQEKIARLLAYFAHLGSLGARQLTQHLESRSAWRWFSEWPVYKTSGTPCAAFTASVVEEGERVDLIVLGMCYKYPSDDDEGWWQDVILPRLRSL